MASTNPLRKLARHFPGQAVTLTIEDGVPVLWVDDTRFRMADDGVTIIATRIVGDLAHVVRLDQDWRELWAGTVVLGNPADN